MRFLNANCKFDPSSQYAANNLYCYCANQAIVSFDPSGCDNTLSYAWRGFYDVWIAPWQDRYNTMVSKPSVYSIGNWLTCGLFDTVKGAVAPEKPWSLQHWLDSASVVGIGFSIYKYGQFRNVYKSGGAVIFPATPQIQFPTDPNRINHIMQPEHVWDRVNATTWSDVQSIIEYVVSNGTSAPYKNTGFNYLYSNPYGNETIEVNVRIVDEILHIVDAWVKTR